MTIKVSIIVPVKDIENYITKCLDTLVNQTLKEIEIICINDGSKDSSLAIINKYAKEDNRIVVLSNKESKGQAYARNLGLNIAKGEYIGFVDGDDWVEEEMFEKLYNNAISNNTDITMCASCIYDEFSKVSIKDNDYYNLKSFDSSFENKVFSHKDTKEFILNINVVIWNKIYKRDFMEKIKARFIEGYIYEDLPFFFHTYLNAKRVTLIRDILYYYRTRRLGATMAESTGKIIDRIDMALLSWFMISEADYYPEIALTFKEWFIEDIFHRYTLTDYKYQKEYFFRMKKVFSLIDASDIDFVRKCGMFSYLDYNTVKNYKYDKCMKLFLSKYKLSVKRIFTVREILNKRINQLARLIVQDKKNIINYYKKNEKNYKQWFTKKCNDEVEFHKTMQTFAQEKTLKSQEEWFIQEIDKKLMDQKKAIDAYFFGEISNQKRWYEHRISELEDQKKQLENQIKELIIQENEVSNEELGNDSKIIQAKDDIKEEIAENVNTTKGPKVSVILPIYNVGKYLRQSLDSLINQTLKEIEIICVNDGSTDDSREILDEYKQKDSRIKVINKENAGTGAARNDGLKIATGECIGFVDPDDWVKEDMYQKLYNLLKEKDLDIAMCMPDGFNEEKQVFETFGYFVEDNFLPVKDKGVFNWRDVSPFDYPMCIWNKLYKKELFDKYNIDFAEGLDFEDHKVIFGSLINAQKIAFIPDKLYVYRHNRPGSILTDNNQRLIDHIQIFNIVENILKDTNTYEQLRRDFIKYKVHNLLYYYGMIKDEHKEEYYNQMLNRLKIQI
jgi:glycosyltransferase involved in cell wall biosynthesis